jgi:serine/threonine-protein kinase
MNSIGRYKNLRELARGGMSTIYLATDPLIKRQVAIKVLPRHFSHDPRFLERFRKEVKVVAALEHKNIVPVYDYGEQDDQPYLVLRYMPGGTLLEGIRQKTYQISEASNILRPIAAALDYAHGHGVVHRDVKHGTLRLWRRIPMGEDGWRRCG